MTYSPMIQQYIETKNTYPDCILFYRLGDFYEMFFDDAVLVSKELSLVLTSKACGTNEKAPMCGIPFHAAEQYISRLVKKGFKVAIAEQISDNSDKRKLMKRDVVRIVTPGTVIGCDISDGKDNSYLMAINFDDITTVSWCDVSTGDFCETEFSDDLVNEKIIETIVKIQPNEIITNVTKSENDEFWNFIERCENILISCIKDKINYLNNSSSMLFAYLKETLKQDISHLEPVRVLNEKTSMQLDKSTIRNLEITETILDKTVSGSLFGILDKCETAMGSRKLKQWMKEPLIDVEKIHKRLNAVETFVKDDISRNNVRQLLKNVYDLERIVAKTSLNSVNPRDLLALRQSLYVIPDIKNELSNFPDEYLTEINNEINSFDDMCNMIDNSIVEEPPLTIREGGIIKEGYSSELDNLKESIKDSKEWLNSLEDEEKKRTGIKNLKLGYNRVFGYYIEVSNSQVSLVPDDYIRRQTIKTGERFVTDKLIEVENIILNAQSSINELEYEVFNKIKDGIKNQISEIQKTAIALSKLDIICNFAEVARKNNYIKPLVNNGDIIDIKASRHPVIEKTLKSSVFVENDIYIDKKDNSLLLITGPNMSGKSTYMRQLALIILMAQIGSFVPASEAIIGICDRIYTRIGANDNISMGQSTFFVEMSELAYILKTMTDNSLVILDEIGRGTGTKDGLAIAKATVEDLNDKKIRTIFATHYNELTNLDKKLDGIKNLNIE